MCLFATCSGCVTRMYWNPLLPKILKVECHRCVVIYLLFIQSPPGNIRNHPELTRK